MKNLLLTLLLPFSFLNSFAQTADTVSEKRHFRLDVTVRGGLCFGIWNQLNISNNGETAAASPALAIGADYYPEAHGRTSIGLQYHLLSGQQATAAPGSKHPVHMISSGYKVYFPAGNSAFSVGPVIGYAWYREKGSPAAFYASREYMVKGGGFSVGASVSAQQKIGKNLFLCAQIEAYRFQYNSTASYKTINKFGGYDLLTYPLSFAQAILLPTIGIVKTF